MKLFSWYEQSFANKIIAKSLLISFISTLFLASASLLISYKIVESQEESLQEKDLIIARNSLEGRIDSLLVELIDLSQDPEVVNGMNRGGNPEIYILPVIRSEKFRKLTHYGLTVLGKKGQRIYSNQDDAWLVQNDLLDLKSSSIERKIQSQSDGNNEIRARVEQQGDAGLLSISVDVISPETHFVLGSIILEAPFLDLLTYSSASAGDPRDWVMNTSPRDPSASQTLLKLQAPLDQLHLYLEFKDPGTSARNALMMLAPSFIGLIFFGLLLSFLLARWIATSIAEPILSLAKGARTVVQFGRVDLEIAQSLHRLSSYKSLDEVGQLLRDESSMLETLRTLQNNLEEQVRKRGVMLNTIFELSPDGYLEINQDGSIGFVNPTLISMLGFGGLDFSNLSWLTLRDLLNERLVDGEQQFDDQFFVQRILRFTTPSLRTLIVNMRVTNAGAMILYVRDLTGEVEMEEMKKAFFAKIAHELRTPLTSILGFSQLLYQTPDIGDKHKESLGIILRQANNLLNLINDLLDIARLESKQVKQLRESSYSLSALTRLILADFKMPEDKRDIQLFLDENLPDIYVDRQHFRQVLVNLLSNAYKYSASGSPIEVRSCETLRSGARSIGLQIRDCGIGMDAVELSQLGTPFYRANPSGSIPGTGLGISVVREIMAQHGGMIEFISNPHVGTTVTIWFPVKSKLDDN